MVAVYFVVPYLLHALVYPWAISLTGRPTLPGYWQGQVPFARGDVRRVVVNLVSEPRAGRCSRCSSITGGVKVCTGGHAGLHEFTGDANDRSASRFHLDVTPGDAPGRYLRELKGQWAGGDQIGITATLMVRDPDGASRSDHQPTEPVRFTMRRGTEADFNAAC